MSAVGESDAHWIAEIKAEVRRGKDFAALNALVDDAISVSATLALNEVVAAFGLPPIVKHGDANPNDPILAATLTLPPDRHHVALDSRIGHLRFQNRPLGPETGQYPMRKEERFECEPGASRDLRTAHGRENRRKDGRPRLPIAYGQLLGLDQTGCSFLKARSPASKRASWPSGEVRTICHAHQLHDEDRLKGGLITVEG
jgi:hypothetical protein